MLFRFVTDLSARFAGVLPPFKIAWLNFSVFEVCYRIFFSCFVS